MTSGLRTDEMQRDLINRLFTSRGGQESVTGVEERRKWLVARHGLKIARVGASPHRTGKAFDLSGDGLNSIVQAVRKGAKENAAALQVTRTLVEPRNNAVHVEVAASAVASADVKPSTSNGIDAKQSVSKPSAKRISNAGPPRTTGLNSTVGAGGANQVEDVRLVQMKLSSWMESQNLGQLAIDGVVGKNTVGAIMQFQTSIGLVHPDGRIEPGRRTARALLGRDPAKVTGREASTSYSRMLEYIKLSTGAGQATSGTESSKSTPSSSPSAPSTTDWSQISANDRMAYAMRRLTKVYGYPPTGAAGIVGNLYAESALIPNRVEGSTQKAPMTSKDSTGKRKAFTAEEVRNRKAGKSGPKAPGVGIAQWTYASRRKKLFEHTYQGAPVGDSILTNMDAQIDYLVSELKGDFKGLHAKLLNGKITVESASDAVLMDFERPQAMLTAIGKPSGEWTATQKQIASYRQGLCKRALAANGQASGATRSIIESLKK